jgi:hypothetical protein
MDRRKLVFAAPALLLMGCQGSSDDTTYEEPAGSSQGWMKLGQHEIGPEDAEVALLVPPDLPRLSRVRAVVQNRGLWVYDMRAGYACGRQQMQDVRLRVLPGTATPDLVLSTPAARLSEIALNLGHVPLDTEPSLLELWGLPA